MYVRVYSVDCVTGRFLKCDPPSLLVEAKGRVVSSGWSSPVLSPWFYVTPPEDGIQDLDFIALPPEPGCIVRPALTPIRGEVILSHANLGHYWGSNLPLKGLRIHSAMNTKETSISVGAASCLAEPVIEARLTYGSRRKEPPSFCDEIGPMFRDHDFDAMQSISGFHLDTLDDVRVHATAILQRLEDGSMPCDGPWPSADVARFRAWVEGGMPS